jgi:hypothetical protein
MMMGMVGSGKDEAVRSYDEYDVDGREGSEEDTVVEGKMESNASGDEEGAASDGGLVEHICMQCASMICMTGMTQKEGKAEESSNGISWKIVGGAVQL